MRRSLVDIKAPLEGGPNLNSKHHLPMGFGMNFDMYPCFPLLFMCFVDLCGCESSGCVILLVHLHQKVPRGSMGFYKI